MKKDIAIAGVGGQGSLFASVVLCQYAMDKGFNVQGTETIGAAQRGGSVVSHMRISDKPIYSPLIPPGTGDILLGLESLELLRHMRLLGPQGYYLLNLFRIPTVYTNLGIDHYPNEAEIIAAARRACPRGQAIRATHKAAELGNIQMTNVVMLGALTKSDDFFDHAEIRAVVSANSPAKFRKNNLAAYEAGYAMV